MVSCNETSKEEELSEDEKSILGVESRKTKEEEGVVISLQHLPSLFSSHEMLQLPNEMRNALIQVLKNPTLYTTNFPTIPIILTTQNQTKFLEITKIPKK